MSDILDFFYIPVTSALFAIVWVYALTDSGQLFGFWPAISNKISKDDWFVKLSYACVKCIAGQVCLWRVIIEFEFEIISFWKILSSIFLALIFEKYYER
jgi:hypothetical protein